MLQGEEVSHDGLVTVDRARIWTLPEQVPDLVAPAISLAKARSAADWADGLITVNSSADYLRQMIDTYREAGGRGKLRLQVHLSWDPDPEKAMEIARDQWRSNVFPAPACWDIDSAEVFDAVSADVPAEVVRKTVLVSSDLGRHAQWLAELRDLGFDGLYLHNVGQHQEAFIEAFGNEVLPQLHS